jgi:hypothetical protein
MEVTSGLEDQIPVPSRQRDSPKSDSIGYPYILYGCFHAPKGVVFGNKFVNGKILLGP